MSHCLFKSVLFSLISIFWYYIDFLDVAVSIFHLCKDALGLYQGHTVMLKCGWKMSYIEQINTFISYIRKYIEDNKGYTYYCWIKY